MTELVIFDLDGTLVDSWHDIAFSVNATLDGFSLPRREPEVIFGFIGGGVHNLIRRSLPEGREDLVEGGVEVFWRIYKEHVLDTTKLYPGVVQLLESLYPTKLAVATNKPYAHTIMALEGLGIASYFRSVQGWKTGRQVKPDPEMLLAALAEVGVSPANAVMVGDGMNDLLAARAAGVRCCLVGYGYGAREKLAEAGADWFAESVEEVGKIAGVI